MNDLFLARSQMGMSLAFHIIFAAIGIALPLMMCLAEALWIRTGDDTYLQLAKRWSKGAAILFAVGAVSGTVLSFELGLLWPDFMRFSGELFGLPFALEGFAFFTEAIFLGIYLYGWKLIPKTAHFVSGIIVSLSSALSGYFVCLANGWMNAPTGFKLVDGVARGIDPIAAMFNPAGGYEAVHMLIAAYAATAFAMAGIHAFLLLKDKTNLFHRKALGLSIALAASMALAQPISGDAIAQMVAHWQPIKLAALEAHFDTTTGAAISIGGIVDQEHGKIDHAIKIPYMLSFLAFHDPSARVAGLNQFPRDEWPNVMLVHCFFQVMVGCGGIMSLVSLWAIIEFVRKRALPDSRKFLWAMTACTPLGFIALEAGWMVTELGRQPWIIAGVMRVQHAVTPMPGLVYTFFSFFIVYLFLAAIVSWLIYSQIVGSPVIKEAEGHAV